MSLPANFLDSIGAGDQLRPAGWTPVWAQLLTKNPIDAAAHCEREAPQAYFTINGSTAGWTSLLTPQAIADQIRARGGTLWYMEAWQNFSGAAGVGWTQNCFIAIYG